MRNKPKKEKVFLDSNELLDILIDLKKEKKYKKQSPPPKFSIQEARFLRDMIFNKPKGLLFYYLADHLMNDTDLKRLPMLNAPSIKKLSFIYNFMALKGNATKAAIAAGYSPRSAKQQGHRILREIQRECRGSGP